MGWNLLLLNRSLLSGFASKEELWCWAEDTEVCHVGNWKDEMSVVMNPTQTTKVGWPGQEGKVQPWCCQGWGWGNADPQQFGGGGETVVDSVDTVDSGLGKVGVVVLLPSMSMFWAPFLQLSKDGLETICQFLSKFDLLRITCICKY